MKENEVIVQHLKPFEQVLYSKEVKKVNDWGWSQWRILVITNKRVINFDKTSIKRFIDLKRIGALILNREGYYKEVVIHIPTEYDHRYSL